MNRHRHIPFAPGGALICLALLTLIWAGWAFPALGEAARPSLNASGNANIRPVVDPIRKSDGYSAVLYNDRNGMPVPTANAIAQTDEGFIWIGSYAGLVRYDGNTFTLIDAATGIANVRCLYVDDTGRLWIGTNDSGLFLMSEERIQRLDRAAEMGLISIRSLAQSDDGAMYVASSSGIGFFDADLEYTPIRDERISGKAMRALIRDRDGLFYGLTVEGDLFTVKGGEVQTYIDHDECRIKRVTALLPDPKKPGIVYLGTEGSEVYYGSLERNFASVGVKDISPLIAVDRFESIDGAIWICAGNGAGKLDSEGFHRLNNAPLNKSVEHVMTDHDGNLWFTSGKQGVMKIVPNRFLDLFNRYDLPEAVVNTTCTLGGRLFIGTDQGLTVIEDEKKAAAVPLTRAVTASGRDLGATDLLELLSGVRIRSVIRDSRDRLWISTWLKYGVLRYDGDEVMAFSTEDGLFSDRVRTVVERGDGSILVVQNGGVGVIEGDRVAGGYSEAYGIANSDILTATEGFNHELILGTDGDGIFIIGPDGGVEHIGTEDGLASVVVMRVKRSARLNVYWIVTGNSLAVMTPDHRVATIRHFPYSDNYDLYENARGEVWVLSSNGIHVVPGDDLLADAQISPLFFGIANGLPCVATSNSYSELTPDGDLIISGVQGAVMVNIDAPIRSIGPLRVSLPYVDADGERVLPNDSGEFIVPFNARKLTIYPYVISYSLLDPFVSCRLEGFDSTDATLRRTQLTPLSYTNLHSGAYRFVIQTYDAIGSERVDAAYPIIKESPLSAGATGSIIMDLASLFLLVGIMLYSSPFRRRGRTDDRLFRGMICVTAVLAVSELFSYLLEYNPLPLTGALMLAQNTLFYAAMGCFPYLLLLYLDYRLYRDAGRVRRLSLPYAIPFALLLILLAVNLKTGWIFRITEKNTYAFGPVDQAVFAPMLLYFPASAFRVYRIDRRLAALGVLLTLVMIMWSIWYVGISTIPFVYTLFLVFTHIHVMNRPTMNEEAA